MAFKTLVVLERHLVQAFGKWPRVGWSFCEDFVLRMTISVEEPLSHEFSACDPFGDVDQSGALG